MIRRSFAVGAIAFVLATLTPVVGGVASATSYDVTSRVCTGPGSFTAAVAAANANPGADVISFAPALQVDWSTCPVLDLKTGRNVAAAITESVTIQGNGAILDGHQYWIDTEGRKSPLVTCPSSGASGVAVVATAPGLFEVGAPGVDSAGVSVVVNNLTFRQASKVAKVRSGASLTLDHVDITDIVPILGNCLDEGIEASAAQVTVRDSRLARFSYPGRNDDRAVHDGVIDGDGRLDIVRSRLIGNQTAGAFLWGGTANVVSSQFIESGGLLHYGGALRFVNSTQYVARGPLGPSDTNTIGLASDAVFEASSISGYAYGCPYCPTNTDALVFRVTGGNVRLRSTAVGNTAERPETSPLVRVMNGGSLTADALTWMQPTALQDGAALIALTGQASLLTAPPGLLENGNQLIDYYPAPVAPLLGTAGTPGVLIDAVPDANGANQLIDPITSTPLTTDVFGNPRVDGNGRRNIGAIQTSLAPYLQIAAIGDGAVSLAWTRPADPVSGAITGYDIRFRRVGDVSWGAPRRVTGPGVLTSVITGLTNGVQYEFEVTGVNDAGEGPASNVVSGKPLGEVGAPAATVTPTEGQANLTWTPPGDWGGHGATTDYFVVYNLAGQRNAPTQVQVNGTSTVIGGLTNGAQYEFCVYARAADSTDGGCVPVGAAIPAAQSTTTTAPAPAPDQSGSALPRTGVTTRPQVAFAAVILLMGVLLVFAARRRA